MIGTVVGWSLSRESAHDRLPFHIIFLVAITLTGELMSLRTTKQWWQEISTDPLKLIDWLKNQFHGEYSAAVRIEKLISRVPNDDLRYDWRVKILRGIRVDEVKHSIWVADLLESRGVIAGLLDKDDRYWKETLGNDEIDTKSFEYLCAVGHLAEVMRLERITLLASDTRFADIAAVFSKILPDEQFHAELFRILSTPEAIEEARANHIAGKNALGLLP